LTHTVLAIVRYTNEPLCFFAGNASPEAVRKLMALSQEVKTRKASKKANPALAQQQKLSTSSLQPSSTSPRSSSPVLAAMAQQPRARSQSSSSEVKLSKESSSVTNLMAASKNQQHTLPRPVQVHRIPKARLAGRTQSRERRKGEA